jgi:hypothetical protein
LPQLIALGAVTAVEDDVRASEVDASLVAPNLTILRKYPILKYLINLIIRETIKMIEKI